MRVLPVWLFVLLAPTAAATQTLRVTVGQTLTLSSEGTTAAYTVDPTIAEASIDRNTVSIVGRRAGATRVIVVHTASIREHDLLVVKKPDGGFASTPARPAPTPAAVTVWDTTYNSTTGRLTGQFETSTVARETTTRLRIANAFYVNRAATADSRLALPQLSFERSASDRQLVLLDHRVQESPLTIDNVRLRGVHYRDSRLHIHAGLASPFLYQSVVIPARAAAAVGFSYQMDLGPGRLTPSVYYLDGRRQQHGSAGVVTTLTFAGRASGSRSDWMFEGGYGGAPVAAGRFTYAGLHDRLSVSARHQPSGAFSLGVGRLIGSTTDAAWHHRIAPRVSLEASGIYSDVSLPQTMQRTTHGSLELRYRATERWTAHGGARPAAFEQLPQALIHSLTIPLGIAYQGRTAGFSALYRYQQSTGKNAGGSGGRVGLQRAWGDVRTTAYFDVQQDAATVDLVFREQPALARAFLELGLLARTPEEFLLALRDHPELLQSGYLTGSSLSLAPRRLQGAISASWRSHGESRQEAKLRLQLDHTRTVNSNKASMMSALSYGRAVIRPLDLVGSVTAWSRTPSPAGPQMHWSFEIAARLRITARPRLPGFAAGGTIRGVVFRDEAAMGRRTDTSAGVAGARLLVDGSKEIVSDAEGRFSVRVSDSGTHTIQLVLDDSQAYFTTAGMVMAQSGEVVAFGVGSAPARLFGTVVSDAGIGLGGVRIALTDATTTRVAVTDSTGGYKLTASQGTYTVALDAGSLPAGYRVSDSLVPTVTLSPATPGRLEFRATAQRSISGVVKAPRPGAMAVIEAMSIAIPDLARTAPIGPDGRFVFRSLPPGRHRLVITSPSRTVTRYVDLPDRPSVVTLEVAADR